MNDSENMSGGNEMDVDQLLASVESEGQGTGEIPMTAPQEERQPAPAAQQQEAQAYKLMVGGREISVPANDPRLTQWASQGYDYAQKMAEFNKQQAQIKELESQYKPVDEWVKQNPQVWQELMAKYQGQTPQQQMDPNNPLSQVVQQLQEEIGQFKPVIEQVLTERQQAQIQKQDQELEGQYESIRKEYPDLDLNAPQPDGQSLEYHVLKFANENGLKRFDHAFKLFNHQHLVSKAAERAKEEVAKDIQKKTKMGLLGKTQAPTKGLTKAQDVKAKSYNDLLEEAIAESGI